MFKGLILQDLPGSKIKTVTLDSLPFYLTICISQVPPQTFSTNSSLIIVNKLTTRFALEYILPSHSI
jgi:hypothetical protein